ncbi:MAG TPA: replicative DNA helicase [Candidatus Dormibacteraeota bacterium]|jgi:replicative DNA helicase
MTLETRAPVSSATPPQNLEAEAAVLGACLVSAEAMERVSDILKPESFYQPRNGHVFRAAVELARRGLPVDIITVRDELIKLGLLDAAGGDGYLAALESGAGIAANVEAHARVIEEASVRRGMLQAAVRIHDLASNVGMDVDAALGRAESEIFRLAETRTTDEAVPLKSLLSEQWEQIERRHEDPNSATGVPSGFYQLDEMTGGFQRSQLVILAARPSVGKALALDTPIPTPNGWSTMGALRVGDQVFDDRGRTCTVTMTTGVMHQRRCYEVTFSDGERITADEDHQWYVRTRAARKRRGEGEILTTGAMAASVRASGGRANYSISTCGPLQYPERDLPIDPYVLGAWLGDGNTHSAVITVGDPEVVAEIVGAGVPVTPRIVSGGRTPQVGLSSGRGYATGAKLTAAEVGEIRAQRAAGRLLSAIATDFRTSMPNVSLIANGKSWQDPARKAPIQVTLRALGVLGNKHVPRTYQEASTAQRLALLQGLMDTDGTIDVRGHAEFTSTTRKLAQDVLELLRGLGLKPTFRIGRAMLGGTDRGPNYRVYFKPTVLPVFRIPRKLNRQLSTGVTASCRHRTIEEIREVPSVPMRCIQVDSPSHLYLAGMACIATHNTSLALNIAQHVAVKEKQAVAVFSLEMSRFDLTQRLLCAEAGVDSKLVRTGKLSETDWAKIANAMGTLSEGQIYIDDRPSLTILELRARARRLKARYDIRLVMIDYLQLMYGSGRPENRNQEVSEISRGLKALARELDCPVIALSQLSRAPEQRGDRKPQLSDLRESGSLEQDADLVMFIYREGLHNDEVKRNKTELMVAKHRNGPTGDVPLLFLESQTRFVNVTRQSQGGPD